MFVVEEDIPPLFVELASHLDDGGMILKALVPRLDDGTIERIVELFKQQDFRFKIIESNIGKFWLKILSKKLNGGKWWKLFLYFSLFVNIYNTVRRIKEK